VLERMARPGTAPEYGDHFERIFATKAPLTKQIIEVGSPRSRFGPADSWVIKIAGGSFCRRQLRD
jgi:hypothetical protein